MQLKRIASKLRDIVVNDPMTQRVTFAAHSVAQWLRQPKGLKLHLGCGTVHKEGYVNIDLHETPATDLVCSIVRLPYPDNSAQCIESYHVIEHLPHVIVDKVLAEWFRVLQGGGRLVIECPNFDETVREYIAGNEYRIFNVYGLQRFEGDYHLFGYNEVRLTERLSKAGFTKIEFREPQDYHKELEPCMRVEAVK